MSYFTDFSKIDKRKYYYDKKAADNAVRYFSTHVFHVKGDLAGTPLILEDWQIKRIVAPAFGWKHRKKTVIKDRTGKVIKSFNKRKYRYLIIFVPKKNGKSSLASGIVQILLDIDGEPGAEIIGLAWGRKQASIVFDMVEKSVRKSPRMNEKTLYYRSSKVLIVDNGPTEAKYSVWSKEAGHEDGQSPNGVVIDESHEHKSGDLIELAHKSMIARSNPLSIEISTAGNNLDGIGYERFQYGKKVAQGIVEDESTLVAIWCAEPEDDIYDPKTWKKANPNWGISIDPDEFAAMAKRAKESPAAENSFKRYHLNIWNNSRDVFISDSVWKASQWSYDITQLKGKTCYGGIDLSSTSDLTALCLIFPLGDEKFIARYWYWLPEEKGTKSVDEKNNRSYPGWVKRGLIEETPGNVVDYEYIIEKVKQLGEIYNIQAIAYDPWKATQVTVALTDAGFNMHKFQQGYRSMSFPTQEMERLIKSKKLNHMGNDITRWMCSNATIKTDPAGNIKLIREKRDQKIDGMVSTVMALGTAMDPELKQTGSYLDENGGELFVV